MNRISIITRSVNGGIPVAAQAAASISNTKSVDKANLAGIDQNLCLEMAQEMANRHPHTAESKLFVTVSEKLGSAVNKLEELLNNANEQYSVVKKQPEDINSYVNCLGQGIEKVEQLFDDISQHSQYTSELSIKFRSDAVALYNQRHNASTSENDASNSVSVNSDTDDYSNYNPIVMFVGIMVRIMQTETRASELIEQSGDLFNHALNDVSDLQKFTAWFKEFYQTVLLKMQAAENKSNKTASNQVKWTDPDIYTYAVEGGYTVDGVSATKHTSSTFLGVYVPTDEVPASLRQYFTQNKCGFCYVTQDFLKTKVIPGINNVLELALPDGDSNNSAPQGLGSWTNGFSSNTFVDQMLTFISDLIKSVSAKADQLPNKVSIHQNNIDALRQIVTTLLDSMQAVQSKL